MQTKLEKERINERVQWGNIDKERIRAIDREYLYVGCCGSERQRFMSAREQEEDGKTHALRGTERDRREGRVYTCVRGRRRRAEGERTRRMQGSSVRGSVVAMGIGGEGIWRD